MQGVKSSNLSYDGRGRGRTRCWTFLVYPDELVCKELCPDYDGSAGYGSAPYNWRSILDSYHVPWIESPLHDKDINPDGSIKKPHWHIMIDFSAVKTQEQIEEVISSLQNIHDELSTPEIQKVGSQKGLIRYMAHLDNPEKYQYDLTDITPHQGADVAEYLLPTTTERLNMLAEILDFIRENQVDNFADLVFYALENKFETWFYVLTTGNSIFFAQLFKSIRYEFKKTGTKVPVDKD